MIQTQHPHGAKAPPAEARRLEADYLERQAVEAFRRHGHDIRGKSFEDLMAELRSRRGKPVEAAG